MSTLNEKLELIQQARDDIQTVLEEKGQIVGKDIRGYAQAISDMKNAKLFDSLQDMQADEYSKEGDLALVHSKISTPVDESSEFSSCTFPQTVVLDEVFSGYVDIMLRSTGEGWFDGWGQLDGNVFEFNGYGEGVDIRIEYTSQDGITYTRTDGGEETVDFGTTVAFELWGEWNPVIGEFMKMQTISESQLYEHKLNIPNKQYIRFYPLSALTVEGNFNDGFQLTGKSNDIIGYFNLYEINNILINYGREYNNTSLFINNNDELCAISDSTVPVCMIDASDPSTTYSFSRYNSSSSVNIYKINLDNSSMTLLEEITPTVSHYYGFYNYSVKSNIICITPYRDVSNSNVWQESYLMVTDNEYSRVDSAYPSNSTLGNEIVQVYKLENKYLPINKITSKDKVYTGGKFISTEGIEIGELGNGVINNNIDRFKIEYGMYANFTNIQLSGSLAGAFFRFKDNTVLELPDTSNVTNMCGMFDECTNLISIPNMNTSNVTDMSTMFHICTKLTNIPNFDTSNVTDMGSMFSSCSSLTNIPELNTSNVTGMSGMFQQCSNLTDINNFNAPNVINTLYMFENCRNLINASNINMQNLKNAHCMFSGCSNLINVDNLQMQNVENVSNMFNECRNLVSVTNTNMSNINNMSNMFNYCQKLASVPNIDTSNVTDMSNAFHFCFNLTNIPNLDTANVTNMAETFYQCNNLTNIPNLDTANVTDMSYMFYGCVNLINAPNLDTSNVINMSYMFRGCDRLKNIYNLNTSNATNMTRLFSGCYNLLSIQNIDTSKSNNLSGLIASCFNLTSVPNLNTSNATNTYEMFSSCSNLTNIPNIDTSNVINMGNMFQYCVNLTTAPNLNTSKVTTMYQMFRSCTNLKNLPELDTSNVSNMSGMFLSANQLSDASIQNIINMCLKSNITYSSYKNLSSTNSYSPFSYTNISNTRYQNRWSELTAAGWSY